MSFQDERAAIESRFASAWASTTKVRYENVEFAEPKDRTAWVSFNIITGDGRQITLGDNAVHRLPGVIVIQVFTVKDGGTAQARTLADQAAAVFRQAEFSSGNSGRILCRTPSILSVGVRDGWYQLNVKIPFIRDVFYVQGD